MATAVQNRVSAEQLRILVVEDNKADHNMFTHVFNSGHALYLAETFKEGWSAYVDKAPHVVFVDVGLPDGNGHDLAKLIKKRNPLTYVIMVTSSPWIDDKKEAANNHVDGFVTKPMTKLVFDNYVAWYKAENNL